MVLESTKRHHNRMVSDVLRISARIVGIHPKKKEEVNKKAHGCNQKRQTSHEPMGALLSNHQTLAPSGCDQNRQTSHEPMGAVSSNHQILALSGTLANMVQQRFFAKSCGFFLRAAQSKLHWWTKKRFNSLRHIQRKKRFNSVSRIQKVQFFESCKKFNSLRHIQEKRFNSLRGFNSVRHISKNGSIL